MKWKWELTGKEKEMPLINCTYESQSQAILEILNEAIAASTALYDYRPRSPESMKTWFKNKEPGQFPVIGVINNLGQLQGFATYGPFRARPAYKYTVEHSVYVHKNHRGQGIGLALMGRLIELAEEHQYHTMIGGIDIANAGSIAFHKKLGFSYAGTIKQAGFKFGRWLDLAFYQLILATPSQPVDG